MLIDKYDNEGIVKRISDTGRHHKSKTTAEVDALIDSLVGSMNLVDINHYRTSERAIEVCQQQDSQKSIRNILYSISLPD